MGDSASPRSAIAIARATRGLSMSYRVLDGSPLSPIAFVRHEQLVGGAEAVDPVGWRR